MVFDIAGSKETYVEDWLLALGDAAGNLRSAGRRVCHGGRLLAGSLAFLLLALQRAAKRGT